MQMYAVLLLILFLPSFSNWLRKTLNITAVFTASPRGHVDFPLGFLSEATERIDVRPVRDSPSEMLTFISAALSAHYDAHCFHNVIYSSSSLHQFESFQGATLIYLFVLLARPDAATGPFTPLTK